MHEWMIYFDLYMGISRWRERWTNRWGGRSKGIWDAALEREVLVLRDGRRLTYFLDGPLLQRHNLPHIFLFHAMFLSGNCFLMAEAPRDYVLVCINRPGYFGSDPVGTDYTYDNFASDMEQLADHLGLETFLVAGHSSGGPCSLACAAHLQKRVSAVGILSGDPEYALESIPNKRKVNAYCLGCFLPWFLRRVICCLPVAKNGVRGLENDFRLETSLYSFQTESVRQPTLVYAGEVDKVLPMQVSRHVHERLENAQLRVVPNVGHLSLLRDTVLRDFFEALLSIASESDVDAGASEQDVKAATLKSGAFDRAVEMT
jgi:pimeloyl-ACP methyl ester carboxylesterase